MPPDQVERLEAFKEAHPGWEIEPPLRWKEVGQLSARWHARSPDGHVEVFEYELRDLIDRMEQLI